MTGKFKYLGYYDMEKYDPNKDYLGPEGNRLSEYIPKYPLGMPQLKPYINKAAYNHDCGYEGYTNSSRIPWYRFLGKISAIRYDIQNRRIIDCRLSDEIRAGIAIEFDQGTLSKLQREIAEAYAETVFKAVDYMGWKFYRINGD